ncbi:MAG: helix-turn-helix domain-containing protein [Tannerellaceae bacterium]
MAEQIKLFRKTKGLSQIDLSKQTGISRTYISTIEAGRQEPSFAFIKTLSTTFGISVDWLLSGQGYMFIQNDVYDMSPDELIKLGQRLACVRKEKGYSEEEMAQYMEVDIPIYKEFEAGTKEPERRSLSFLISGLRVNYDWLLNGVGEMDADSARLKEKQEKAISVMAGNADMIDHILLLSELPPHRRKEVYAYTRDRRLLANLEDEQSKEYEDLV